MALAAATAARIGATKAAVASLLQQLFDKQIPAAAIAAYAVASAAVIVKGITRTIAIFPK